MLDKLPSLLLLPPPPSPVSPPSVSAAYRPSIEATVSALRVLETRTELLVVLPCSFLCGNLETPRSHVYDQTQRLLAGLYGLIYQVCAKLGVEVESETPGSIDARIIFLEYDSSKSFPNDHASALDASVLGPIVSLPVLATTRRKWNFIFSVDGEEGQKLLASYSALASRLSPPLQGDIKLVRGGVSMIQHELGIGLSKSLLTSSPSHLVVAVGGTFDHIHAGHKLLLTATALLLQPASATSPTPRRLIIGITGDELLKNKKYSEYLKNWKERQNDVVQFLLSILSFTRSSSHEVIETSIFNEPVPNGRGIHTTLKSPMITIECVEIQDPFGPTITDESITALVVSGETRSGGKAINDKRREKGWKELEVFEVDVLDADDHESGATKSEDFTSKISSTAIRKRKAESARASSSL